MIHTAVVGAGKWAHECWAPLLREHASHYVVDAVVDPDERRARSLAQALGLSERSAYAGLEDALACVRTIELGIVLSSPERHAGVIRKLLAAGCDVLTEKPLATDPAEVRSIAASVDSSGRRLAVIQNYRYQNRIQTARRMLAVGGLGELRFIAARFAADYRVPGSWDVGDAHAMAHPLLVEGSIHHIDMIRYLSGHDIHAVTAITANPTGSSFAGDCVGAVLLDLGEGRFGVYEANLLAAGAEQRWRNEHYRLECADGALVCDGANVVVTRERHSQVIPAPDHDMFDGHRVQLRAFADWVDGGPALDTTIEDNSRSLAALFAAVRSSESGGTVAVEELR